MDEDFVDIDESMTGQEVLQLKRRELDTLYSEIKLLDEAIPRKNFVDEVDSIVPEAEAYAMIMDLRAQLKMTNKENEALKDEKKVLDRLIRTKDQALVQLSGELQASTERLLGAEARIREMGTTTVTDALTQRANTAAAADAAAERARRNLERDMARVTAAKKDRPDPGDPFYDLVISLGNRIAELNTEVDTLNKHVRLLTGENRRKDRAIAQLSGKIEENNACQADLLDANSKVSRLTHELNDLRELYTKLTNATAGDLCDGASPLSPGGERALNAMELPEVQEIVRNKQRILKVLEEENAVLRQKQLEWESSHTQVIAVDPMDNDAPQSQTVARDYHERRLLQVELKKLREARSMQDKTIKTQQQRINQLTDRLEFVAKSLRTASTGQRKVADTAPVADLDVPASSAEYLAKHSDENDCDDVVPATLYDFVVGQLVTSTTACTELQEALNERQMALERSEKSISILQHSIKSAKVSKGKTPKPLHSTPIRH